MLDIYNFKQKLDLRLKYLEECDICEENKSLIRKFIDYCFISGLSLSRQLKYLNHLLELARLLGKPFDKANKDDWIRVFRKIESSNLSYWTRRDFYIAFKRFYKWLWNREPDLPYRPKGRAKKLIPEELLSEEEVLKLVKACDQLRDKALILTLYETGCRVGEILSLRLKDVTFDEDGAVLLVNGKTGMRRVRVIASAPKLAQWINNHPFGDNLNAPLWPVLVGKNKGKPLSYCSFKELLYKIAAKAGIKKRVYPHLFRHSRATLLANFLREAQLKQYFGWVQSSKMAAVYVHLSGRDVDDALLELNGLKRERMQKLILKVKLCSKCGAKNSPDERICVNCYSKL